MLQNVMHKKETGLSANDAVWRRNGLWFKPLSVTPTSSKC